MIKVQLSATNYQLQSLKEHLLRNGYHFEIDFDEEILEVDLNEWEYVKTILFDWGIGYVED